MRYENLLWSEAVGNRSTLEKLALNVSMFYCRSLQQSRGADALRGHMGPKRPEGSAGSLKTSPQVLCAYLSTSPQTSHSVVYKECKKIPACPLRLCVSPEPERLLRWPLYDFTPAWGGFVYRFLLSLSMFSGYVFLFSVTWPLSILSLAVLLNLWSLPGSNLKLHFCAPLWVGWTLFFTSFCRKKKKKISHWHPALSVWTLLRPASQIQDIVHLSTSVAVATALRWLSAYNNRQIRGENGLAARPQTFHSPVIGTRGCEVDLCSVVNWHRVGREVLSIFKSDALVRKWSRLGISLLCFKGAVECCFQFNDYISVLKVRSISSAWAEFSRTLCRKYKVLNK